MENMRPTKPAESINTTQLAAEITKNFIIITAAAAQICKQCGSYKMLEKVLELQERADKHGNNTLVAYQLRHAVYVLHSTHSYWKNNEVGRWKAILNGILSRLHSQANLHPST